MELKMPSPEQAHWGLRAMKTVAMADGALDESDGRGVVTCEREMKRVRFLMMRGR